MYPVMLGRLVGIDGVILSYRNIYMCCLYSFSFCAAFLDINFDRCDEYILYVHSDTLSKIKTRLCTRLRCFYMLRYFTVNFLQLCDTSIFSPPPQVSKNISILCRGVFRDFFVRLLSVFLLCGLKD